MLRADTITIHLLLNTKWKSGYVKMDLHYVFFSKIKQGRWNVTPNRNYSAAQMSEVETLELMP